VRAIAFARLLIAEGKGRDILVVRHVRAVTVAALLIGSLAFGGVAHAPAAAAGSPDAEVRPTALLDGKSIPLADVSRYYCDDFNYPVIQCSTSELVAEARATQTSLLAAVEYVTVYQHAFYAGSWMNVSQDYSALFLIGWDDRISSFKARNSETGRFFTDWLYGGSIWSFCCNQQQTSLGGYNDTFSSIART
jgi:hypothetical protein